MEGRNLLVDTASGRSLLSLVLASDLANILRVLIASMTALQTLRSF